MTFKIIQTGTSEYQEMIALRMEVLLEPIGIPVSYIDPKKETEDLLICLKERGKMEGCCILTRKQSGKVQLRQMAIRKAKQGTGYGRHLVAFAEEVATSQGFEIIVLHARNAVIPFYEKCGYHIVGDGFEEVGIGHHIMEKKIKRS